MYLHFTIVLSCNKRDGAKVGVIWHTAYILNKTRTNQKENIYFSFFQETS